MAVLNDIVDFVTTLIGAEGTKTPRKCYRISFVRGLIQGSNSVSCGSTGQGRPHRSLRCEEAPRTARGKRSAFRCNQQPSLTQPYVKKKSIFTLKSTFLVTYFKLLYCIFYLTNFLKQTNAPILQIAITIAIGTAVFPPPIPTNGAVIAPKINGTNPNNAEALPAFLS